MPKFEIPMARVETRLVEIFAETPHDAIRSAKELNQGFQIAEYISQLGEDPDEPGTEIEVEGWAIQSYCETCSKPILTGDKYYQWGGEDAVQTCEDCGGADKSHEPSIAD